MTTIGSQPVIESAEALSARQPSPCGPSSGNHPNIRTSRPLAPALECSDVRLVGQETRKRVVELRCPALLSGAAWFVLVSASISDQPLETVLSDASVLQAVLLDTDFGRDWLLRTPCTATDLHRLPSAGLTGTPGPRGQGECGPAEHGPDAEPGSHVTSAGSHTRRRYQEQTR